MNRRGFLGLVSISAVTGLGLYKYHIPQDISNAAVDSIEPLAARIKVQNFDNTFVDDVHIDTKRMPLLVSIYKKLNYLQTYVGYANFSILGFSDLLAYSRNVSKIDSFDQAELDLINDLFAVNAKEYGFLGERVNFKLYDTIDKRVLTKVSSTGQYVYKGQSLDLYKKLKQDVGDELILTSGVRGMVKQLFLFVKKAVEVKGNLSRASRSLAPPGHSYHAIGDFDVGMRGLGELNFTKEFANTPVYEHIHSLKYINIRYHETNTLGVRYEPWHIKVV